MLKVSASPKHSAADAGTATMEQGHVQSALLSNPTEEPTGS